jgi:hypothetical protein
MNLPINLPMNAQMGEGDAVIRDAVIENCQQ